VAGPNEGQVRRALEVINSRESVDIVMAELEELMHPEIEFVNPQDAIEGGRAKAWLGCGQSLRTSLTEPDTRRRSRLRR
jgi:hypothetical protein